MTITSLPLPGDVGVSLAERARRSVVQIEDGGRGAGAGVVWDARGLVMTNAHVVRGDAATVTTVDGERLDGRVEARDDSVDLAALRVARNGLDPLESGDSRSLRPGQLVLAIGHPLGITAAVTVGIVTRPPAPDDARELIASNITLNRGNSGGPLLDASGRLLGINTMVAGPGLGLTIPAHVVQRFLAWSVGPRPHIGVTAQPVESGLMLVDVMPEGPAEAAGLMPGDVIVAVSSVSAGHPNILLDGLIHAGVGGRIALDIQRAGQPLSVSCAVVARA